ncbi:conserved hypothetical protein, secreted [Candidatus Magnetomorum sp. HK-1]|nr:conserved hypothetical protein, secreted [Candidatus Magnetomorum sp. HK-1]
MRLLNNLSKKRKQWYFPVISLMLTCIFLPVMGYAFYDNSHMNSSEDAIVFMETRGTIQQRWCIDYLKTKTGGRKTGSPFSDQKSGDSDEFNQIRQEEGLIGNARAGAIVPDYFQDFWWYDTTEHNWHFDLAGASKFYQNNYTSYSHFMNLIQTNYEGKKVVANNFNDYDGYSYNGSYGFDSGLGYDITVATLMNNSMLTIDLPNCTECAEKYSMVPNGNPASDYRQNGSITPVGSPGKGGFKIGNQDGTNYNCFSDTFGNNCPDIGSKSDGIYQLPNTTPGDYSYFTSDEDWVIMEPLDNAATFYYNEWFLEGGASRNSQKDSSAIDGRYYSLSSQDVNYLTAAIHYAGDANVQIHIWNTLGFNHAAYEEWIEGLKDDSYGYGKRTLGASDPKRNFEDFNLVEAYIRGRANDYSTDRLDVLLTENSFLTYLARENRDNSDIMLNEDNTTRKTAAIYAVNQAITTIAMMYEKAVLELRKYR